MSGSINTNDFFDKQVEKLSAAKGPEPIQNTPPKPEEPIVNQPTVIPNGFKDAVQELSQNGAKPVVETVQKTATIDNKSGSEGAKKEEGDKEEEKEVVPSQARVDLDKNREEAKPKSKKEVDTETEAHLNWLQEEEASEVNASEKKDDNKPNYEEEIKTYKTKVQEYESVLNDDYIKAVIEFRKAGGTDLNELSAHLGIVDPNKVTIEDFYSQKAADQGLKGEELTEAVAEAVERYQALPKLDQAEILNNFKNTLKSKTEEKLKSFSTANQGYRQEQEKIQKAFLADLDKEVSAKVGKKWRGLLIDEKMSKEIKQAAPNYAVQKFDANGNFIGYDAEHGVEMAIYAKFGKKLLKAQYDLAKVSAYDELIEERNRPSENMTSNQIVVNAPNNIERITKEIREEKKRKSSLTTAR